MRMTNPNIESVIAQFAWLASNRSGTDNPNHPLVADLSLPVDPEENEWVSNPMQWPERFRSLDSSGQARWLERVIHQTNDHIGRLQTLRETLQQQTLAVRRMRELAFKSTRDTLPDDQRERFQEQFRQLQQQVADRTQSISSDPPGGLPGHPLAGFESTALRSPETAEAILPRLDDALSALQQQRESIHSVITRLAQAEDPLGSQRTDPLPVPDPQDVEILKALSQEQIKEHMDLALLAQAIPQPDRVIFLLQ